MMAYQCSWCGRIFYSSTVFKKHLLDVHVTDISVEDQLEYQFYHTTDPSYKDWYKTHLKKLGEDAPLTEKKWLENFF